MKPLIAICPEFEERQPGDGNDCSYTKLYHQYYQCLIRAGAVPCIVPVSDDPETAIELLTRVDGVLLTGGDDFVPPGDGAGQFHPSVRTMPDWRQRQYWRVCNYLLQESDLPVLAICAGMQVSVLADGGRLIEDIPSQIPSAIEHRDHVEHQISIKPDSRLARITSIGGALVNSVHHQAVQPEGEVFRICAIAADGIVEAVETRDESRFYIGVQWHPELMEGDPMSAKLFRALVDASRDHAGKKQV